MLSTTCRTQVVSAGAKTPANSSRTQHSMPSWVWHEMISDGFYHFIFNLNLSIHTVSSFRID